MKKTMAPMSKLSPASASKIRKQASLMLGKLPKSDKDSAAGAAT